MTKEERLVVSAFTGTLMVEWPELLEFAEERLGRPILAKEVDSEEFADEVKNSVLEDFMELCQDDDEEDILEKDDDEELELN